MRLACTEVVYRSYQAGAGVPFELDELAGRLCLSAESLMNQVMQIQAFKPVALYGVNGIKAHQGEGVFEKLKQTYSADWGEE